MLIGGIVGNVNGGSVGGGAVVGGAVVGGTVVLVVVDEVVLVVVLPVPPLVVLGVVATVVVVVVGLSSSPPPVKATAARAAKRMRMTATRAIATDRFMRFVAYAHLRETATVNLWLLRIVWATLPVTAGTAASDALGDWSTGPQITGATLVWVVWAVALLASFALRPIGLTALRAIAPAFLVLSIVQAVSSESAASWAAVAALAVAAALVAHPDVAVAAANGVAYGDERRFPLRTPPALFLLLLPLTRAIMVAGIAVGPILLANGNVVGGLATLAIGVPLVAFAARALHTLSRRWVVLVPAGLVIVDPMTLVDPVLFPREHIRSLQPLTNGRPPPDALDLRLGATAGSMQLTLDDEADLQRSTPGRRGGTNARATQVVVAVTRPQQLLETAAQRRLRVEVR